MNVVVADIGLELSKYDKCSKQLKPALEPWGSFLLTYLRMGFVLSIGLSHGKSYKIETHAL